MNGLIEIIKLMANFMLSIILRLTVWDQFILPFLNDNVFNVKFERCIFLKMINSLAKAVTLLER